MPGRIVLVATALVSSFLFGVKVNDMSRDKIELRALKAREAETAKLIEKNYRSGLDLTKKIAAEEEASVKIRNSVNAYLKNNSTCPVLPPGWRVLHNSAATGSDPASSSGNNGAPVPIKDAASTVAENYSACRKDKERLIALQSYINELLSMSDWAAKR